MSLVTPIIGLVVGLSISENYSLRFVFLGDMWLSAVEAHPSENLMLCILLHL